ncbi:hypothetical protein LshimejAT787_0109740 [Lyophyllum shimeji]|uniref:Uncharacterized protein n=1 Tax=Lyophyllum shimeji TaxID=47721 RepID=A0A9P3UK45_LYOSH|nr:hypothetical protein LshimejAT787_0109740 [Lyophyllum shimeji]
MRDISFKLVTGLPLLADQDPQLSGLGKNAARSLIEARIRSAVQDLATKRPPTPRVKGWNCAEVKLCFGKSAFDRGKAAEDSNIGRWYQRRNKIGHDQWITVFLSAPLDNADVTSEPLSIWLAIREELRPTARNTIVPVRAATPSGPSSPSTSAEVPSRMSRATSPSSSSTLAPLSPPRLSSFDIDFGNRNSARDYTRGVRLFIWTENNASHVPVVLFPRRDDGYLHLWDHKLELGAHGIEAANALDMYGGRLIGWNSLSWTTPIVVDFAGQAYFLKKGLLSTISRILVWTAIVAQCDGHPL